MIGGLPDYLGDALDLVVTVLRRVYDQNAERFDELSGDDGVTFGSAIYRNSWYQLEEEFKQLPGWRTARPRGSLVLSYGDYRVHVYRCGQDEDVHLDRFRLDEAQASATKRAIAEANSDQLTLFDSVSDQLPLFAAARHEIDIDIDVDHDAEESDLPNLVVLHAGNPVDGCCGVWVGAPLSVDDAALTPWAWIEPSWLIERPEHPTMVLELGQLTRHDELPEPELDLTLARPDDRSATREE